MAAIRFLSLLATTAAMALPATAADFLLTPVRPNRLVVVDAQKMAIEKVITLDADAGPTPAVPVVDAAGRYAYVTMKKTESIAKVDLATGATVARIDMSTEKERVKSLFGMDLSPDGKTLAVYQSPVALLPTHFEVEPTRIALYDAETMTLRTTFEAPRQVTLLMYSRDGSKLYALSRAMHVLDAGTGAPIAQMPIHGWKPETYAQPDVLDVWSQFESSNMMVTPFYTMLKAKSPTDPEAWRTGLLTLDLATGEMDMRDVRRMDVFYFSTAASPDKTRAYGAYNVLESFDLQKNEPIRRVPLPHSYYSVNVSSDGRTVWLGGALGDLAAYDAETLEKKGQVDMPDGAAISLASTRLFTRAQ